MIILQTKVLLHPPAGLSNRCKPLSCEVKVMVILRIWQLQLCKTKDESQIMKLPHASLDVIIVLSPGSCAF